MSDTYTPNLNLTKPAVGGSRDTWGTKTNGDWDIVDGVFAAAGNGTSVGLNVGAGKTLSVAGTLTASGTVSLPAAATAGGATIVSTTGTQTLTNKTLTAPAIGGQASYAAGTVSAPSITFSGDTNTGIYSPAADTIAFTEGGVESMRIDASGRVGINTASPASPLEVSSTSQFSGIALTGTGRAWSVGSNSTTLVNVNYQHDAMAFTASGSERMRIDASGNVGIGLSNPGVRADINGVMRSATWSLSGTGISGGTAAFAAGTVSTDANWGMYFRAPTGSSAIAEYSFRNSADAERMRIDASGNVGIGTSSPAYRLQVNSPSSAGFAALLSSAQTGTTVRSNPVFRIQSEASGRDVYMQFSDNIANATEIGMLSGNMYFCTSAVERARITSGGDFLVGATAAFTTNTSGVALRNFGTEGRVVLSSTNSGADLVYFYTSTALAGSIVTSGGTSTAYNTTSDYRFKQDVAPLTNASDRVRALKPCRFRWIADPSRTVDGFIAHEAAEVVPEAVTGEKDAVNEDGSIKPQGIDQSKLVPLLTAALQEALTEIASLKARVAALENK